MTVRAKFKLDSYAKYAGDSADFKFSPVYGTSEENKKFFKATPSGQLVIGTVNPEVAAQLELGKEYYIDIIPAA